MLDRCFKVAEGNILTPLSRLVNHMHIGAKMLKKFQIRFLILNVISALEGTL